MDSSGWISMRRTVYAVAAVAGPCCRHDRAGPVPPIHQTGLRCPGSATRISPCHLDDASLSAILHNRLYSVSLFDVVGGRRESEHRDREASWQAPRPVRHISSHAGRRRQQRRNGEQGNAMHTGGQHRCNSIGVRVRVIGVLDGAHIRLGSPSHAAMLVRLMHSC